MGFGVIFFIGWLCGIATVVFLAFALSMRQNKNLLLGVAKTPAEAADKVMQLLNASEEVRADVKNRLDASS